MPSFDPAIVQIILAGALGLTVLGLTQMLKTWLKVSGIAAYLISFAVSGGATAYYLVSTHSFTIVYFIGYTFLVFLSANGIYKATAAPNP
jgi:hypothetical protein